MGEIAESFGAGKIESSGTDKADDKADDKATENTNTFFQRASDVARRQLGTGALKLVWPTMGEVRDSNLGYATGGSIPGTGEFILIPVCMGNSYDIMFCVQWTRSRAITFGPVCTGGGRRSVADPSDRYRPLPTRPAAGRSCRTSRPLRGSPRTATTSRGSSLDRITSRARLGADWKKTARR